MVTETARARRNVGQIDEAAAARSVTVEQPSLSGVGPDLDHRFPLP